MRVWRRSVVLREDGIESRIRDVLAAMLPLLRLETSVITLVSYDVLTGVAVLSLTGDCPDCQMSAATLHAGIEAHLRTRIPQIRAVRLADHSEPLQ